MTVVRYGNVSAEPGTRATGFLSVGELDQLSFARGQIQLPLLIANGAKPGPTLFLMAGQHSGEYVGMEAVIAIARDIDVSELAGAIVGIPIMNTFGFAQKVPYVCPLDNLNMNRLWPGNSGGTVGQRITYTVWNEIINKVDYVIDMHGGDFPEHQADYAISFVTGDPELDARSEAMARHYLLPYIRKSPLEEGTAPTGPSARMAMNLLGKPAIVSELGDAGILEPERLEQAVQGVYNILRLLNMLPGDPEPPPTNQKTMISRTPLLASVHGICRLKVTIHDHVSKGQPVADIVNYFGDVLETLRSPCDGVVVQTFYQSATNPGNIVMKIARIAEYEMEPTP